MNTTTATPETARRDVAGLPLPSLTVMAQEIEQHLTDPTLTRSQRAYVRSLLLPWQKAIRAELAERERAA